MQTNMTRTITAANSVLLVKAVGYSRGFVPIEQYAADNAFDFSQTAVTETTMGVDGYQSGGWVPSETDFNISLAPNSPSRSLFDGAKVHMQNQQETIPWEFDVTIPSIGKRYTATGFMVQTQSGTSAKKVLDNATYSFKIVVKSEQDI
ncbi:phage tail fiber protein [Actinobacillus seminis]|uniref:phage tail fiber protein n=1 Tax=Actinobacillus seminis TaxID=722 RepID=UPI003B9501E1